MKAIVQTRYGLRNLRIVDLPKPVPGENQVLVRVHAAALNYAVMFRVSGKPVLARLMMGSLLKPKRWIPGGELSGRVEAIGAKVRAFKPGDEVYGDTCKCGYGALAELVCADESALAPILWLHRDLRRADSEILRRRGKVRSIIDQVYPLSETDAAFRSLGKGHARGRVVVRVGQRVSVELKMPLLPKAVE